MMFAPEKKHELALVKNSPLVARGKGLKKIKTKTLKFVQKYVI